MNLKLQPVTPRALAGQLIADCTQCWKAADYARVIEILQRVHHMDPTDYRILCDLGLACAMSYDFSTAERYFEKAIALAQSKTDALMAVAHNWRKVRNYEAGANALLRVLEQPNVPTAAYLRLAEFYERGQKLEGAREITERALRAEPGSGAALLTQARVLRQQRQLEKAEEILRLIVGKDHHALVHPAAWDELGTVLDAQGRYDEAMAAFVNGKKLMQSQASRSLSQLQLLQGSRKQISDTISEKTVQRWRQVGETELQAPRRLALLGGHPRSGTTLLEYVIDSHPQAVSADETFVFSTQAHLLFGRSRTPVPSLVPLLDSLAPRILRQTRADYFRRIENFLGTPVGDRLLIDKNPVLTSDIPAFYRIFPESKFLIALRDPRDVCLSCFMQSANMSPDAASWLTLAGTITNYASIMNGWISAKRFLPNALEVRYEDMVENLEGSARRTLAFLGCEWDERVLRFDEHARGKLIRSPTFADVTKPVYKTAVRRWVNYEKYFQPFAEKLAPFLDAFGYK